MQLTLFVSFADGGIERKTVDIQVDQPARPPEKLTITYGGGDNRRDHDIISMDLSDPHRRIDLFAAAIFKNLSYPVPLKALDVSFKWISPGGVAQIDPSTGIVTALNLGQALLETSFAGVSTLTCIDVKKNVAVASRSGCAELLPPGRSLPPMDFAPPTRVKVRER